MTPEEYRERAEHYRQAQATAKDSFARQHLAAMEQSYRTLADSEEALRKSRTVKDSLDQESQPELSPKAPDIQAEG